MSTFFWVAKPSCQADGATLCQLMWTQSCPKRPTSKHGRWSGATVGLSFSEDRCGSTTSRPVPRWAASSAGAMASAPRSLPRNKFLWLLRSSRPSFADTTTDNDHARPIDDRREHARFLELRDRLPCIYFDRSFNLTPRAPDALGAPRVLLQVQHLPLTPNTSQDGSHARPLPLGHPQ